jgi:hypothetical protein
VVLLIVEHDRLIVECSRIPPFSCRFGRSYSKVDGPISFDTIGGLAVLNLSDKSKTAARGLDTSVWVADGPAEVDPSPVGTSFAS